MQGNGSTAWQVDTIRAMLRNPAYTTGNGWPAIIPEPLFQAAQRRRADYRRKPTPKGAPPSIRKNGPKVFRVFRGLLRCECGETLWPNQGTGGKVYYYCSSRRLGGSQCPHAKKGVRESELMPWMDNLVAAWERAGIDGRFLTREDEPDRATIADAIAKLERRLERTKRLYLAGDMSDEEYDAERERLGRQRQAYELAAAEAAQTADPAELDSIASMWRSEDGATRAKVLWSLFDRLTVKDYAIVDYTPRSDRIRLTTALVEAARRPNSPAAVTLADHVFMSDEELAEMEATAEREGRAELARECGQRNADPATY